MYVLKWCRRFVKVTPQKLMELNKQCKQNKPLLLIATGNPPSNSQPPAKSGPAQPNTSSMRCCVCVQTTRTTTLLCCVGSTSNSTCQTSLRSSSLKNQE